jgi:hypothetical protein
MKPATPTETTKGIVKEASKGTPKARKEVREAKAVVREPQRLQMENPSVSGSTILESIATQRSAATLTVVVSVSARLIPPFSAQVNPRDRTLVKVNLLD